MEKWTSISYEYPTSYEATIWLAQQTQPVIKKNDSV
jgi:hypothetical protein